MHRLVILVRVVCSVWVAAAIGGGAVIAEHGHPWAVLAGAGVAAVGAGVLTGVEMRADA